MKTVVIIPARYASTRFPGKPLAEIRGKTMIGRVCDQVAKATSISEYLVATDDSRIYEHCINEKRSVIMTSDDHQSGTDRVAEAAQSIEAELIINVQGDEPFLDPEELNRLAAVFSNPQIEIATFKSRITDLSTLQNQNVVKVVADLNDQALYFSRSVIPFIANESPSQHFRHHGIYAFRRAVLLEIVEKAPTMLEKAERLEQLRWMEHGHRIHVLETTSPSPAIDTPEDLVLALNWMDENQVD